MAKHMLGPLTVRQLAVRTWREINNDNVWGASAELAYYFTLAIFPMLLFLVSIVGFFGGLRTVILNDLARIAPPEAMNLVKGTLSQVLSKRSGGLLSIGLLTTLWAASQGVSGLIDTLNAAFEVKETRPFWRVKLLALGLTIALGFLVVAGSSLIMFGDESAEWLGGVLGYGKAIEALGAVAHYVLGLWLLLAGIQIIYAYAPNARVRWKLITPGSAFAVFALTLVSLLFSVYLRVAPAYSALYGGLGAMIVLMIWLYLLSFVLLTGGEIDSEIEKATRRAAPEYHQVGGSQRDP